MVSKNGNLIVPAGIRPYKLLFFDKSGRTVYTDTCSFKPDIPYVKAMLPIILVKLLRKGKTDLREYTIGVMECNVTIIGKVNDFLEG